ncbi:H-type small acid-soluble spore protein [Paenibacillus sp. TAF43_2]|uniref:H-type small acid-soluble spore protein n=1 Tax=Paenibacillus sp. TAF43_2 TaxID=3233069 RepID=UPI003F9CF794
MNIQRAQEIVDSPNMANVTYEGLKIYIQDIDEITEMARIFPLDDPEKELTVPLHNLSEE